MAIKFQILTAMILKFHGQLTLLSLYNESLDCVNSNALFSNFFLSANFISPNNGLLGSYCKITNFIIMTLRLGVI